MKYIVMIKKIALFSLISVLPATSFAIKIEEALTNGYNNDEDLQIIRTDFLISVESFPAAISEFMPRVYARIDSTHTKIKGKHYDASVNNSVNNNSNSLKRTIVFEQPIFDGWSSVAKLRAAQAGFMSSRAIYYAKEQEALLQEIEIYISCIEAKEKYSISAVSVVSNKTQLDAMREKFRLGESTETEVASAREALATAESKHASAQAVYERAKANFYRVFGVEAENLVMPNIPEGIPGSPEELVERALVVNPLIDNVKYNAKATKSNLYSAKGQLLPKAAFSIQNGDTGFNPQSTISSGSSNVNSRSITSTLTVTIPIFSKGGAEYSEIRKTKHAHRKSVLDFDKTVKQVTANSRSEWSIFNATKESVRATNESVSAAEVAYEGMIQEEMLGSKTIVDVLRAEGRLNDARQNVVEARKAMILSAYKIKQLIGELTAKSLELPVDYFEPEKEFKKVKMKVIGF